MSAPEVTVVIPVAKRADDLDKILALVREGLSGTGKSYDIVMVVDGELPERLAAASAVADRNEDVRVLRFARRFGEGAALRAGLLRGEAPILITHPAYFQVESGAIGKLLDALEEGAEVAFASRLSGNDSLFNRLQRWVFNALLRASLGVRARDFACGVRAIKRDALEEIALHAGFHRFISVAAVMSGLEVKEVDAAVHPESRSPRTYSPATYLRRIIDIANVYFLTKFLHRPLRFFGVVGTVLFVVGFLLTAYLTIERFMGTAGLAGRPLFLLGVLLTAFGFQILALGLLGEIVSFSDAARSKPYRVRELIRKTGPGAARDEAETRVGASPGKKR